MRNKLRIGQQVMCGMSHSWGKHIVVALGIEGALLGCYTEYGYAEHAEPYFLLKNHNKHLFKGEN